MNILIITILLILAIYCIFLFLLKNRIKQLELYIIESFKKRNNLIPAIYETTKSFFVRHDDIFKEILDLKRVSFIENQTGSNLNQIIQNQKLIHNELDFIFNISNKHYKIEKDYKYNYIKDILNDISEEIGSDISTYKQIVKKLNSLIFIKNITIIGLLIPINKIENI